MRRIVDFVYELSTLRRTISYLGNGNWAQVNETWAEFLLFILRDHFKNRIPYQKYKEKSWADYYNNTVFAKNKTLFEIIPI